MKRLVPEIPFPPYTYVPGLAAHPFSDPKGHSFGRLRPAAKAADPLRWWECKEFLYGVDLFNGPAPLDQSSSRLPPGLRRRLTGFYWEAHEEWEGLWHACGRTGPTADFLRGLIKLAAAGVKAREGVPQGVASHAARAAGIFQEAARLHGENARFFGLRLALLITCAREFEALALNNGGDRGANLKMHFDFVLDPQAADGV